MTIPGPVFPDLLGGKLPRVDASLKVTGEAMYTSDISLPGMLYAVPVCATIASGTILSVDATAAKAMPGVVAVYHRGNIAPFHRSATPSGFHRLIDEARPPFEDDVVRYYGQYVAVAVAETFEQATAASEAVRVRYATQTFNVDRVLNASEPPTIESERGKAEKAFRSAPVRVDGTYVIPTETHNPIELHATVAVWDDDTVTLYETTQSVVNHREVLSQMLGVPIEKLRIVSHFLGSGFGGKLWPWPHSLLAAGAARELRRPVKLVINRQSMFQSVGHRPRTQQHFRIGAMPDGKLVSVQHDYFSEASLLDRFREGCGAPTPYMYSVPNLRVTWAYSRRNVGAPTSMRGPGGVSGLFAMESAMDELAVALKMDPVELRRRNEPTKDEGRNRPFSSRHLQECITLGATKFGWSNRDPRPGSMKMNGVTLGWGMSAATWEAQRFDAEATVDLLHDGTARVSTAAQDIGTGTYTVLALIVSRATGVPIDRIDVRLGDTTLPPGPISGGSRATASVIDAVIEASNAAIHSLLQAAVSGPNAPFNDARPADLRFAAGKVTRVGNDSSVIAFGDLLARLDMQSVSGRGKSSQTSGSKELKKYSLHSYGAHFCEVTWQPEIARLRVKRFVTVIDAGRIINPIAGRNQIEGAIVMGVGMALLEATHYDRLYGAPINSNLADYIVATNADGPEIDVTFLEYPDLALNELGARGIGEIGLAGAAPAIANAVYHATGVRVRELPITIEKLL